MYNLCSSAKSITRRNHSLKLNKNRFKSVSQIVRSYSAQPNRHQENNSTSVTSSRKELNELEKAGILTRLHKWLSKENIVADENWNRWKSVPAAFLVQVSIGSVYTWSIFNIPLTRTLGVVAPSSMDWDLTSVVPIFSACAVFLGISTALLGPWAEKSGPRYVATVAGLSYSCGLFLSALGVIFHKLPLLYLGFGLFGGIGWGLGYIAHVSTLLRWFPDRRGFAAGMALTAFGAGALIATPVYESLFNVYFDIPTFVGSVADVSVITDNGVMYADVNGVKTEVVLATSSDLLSLPSSTSVGTLSEGYYVVGSGNYGTAKVFATAGTIYLFTVLSGAFMQRVPSETWKPEGWNPTVSSSSSQEISSPSSPSTKTSLTLSKRIFQFLNNRHVLLDDNVHHNTALKAPQFYLLWMSLFGNAIAGVSIIACAKNMMTEIFGNNFVQYTSCY
eukprot:TRINITY_DN2577_c0_g1_i2.p1 TRINITY_DN2577_c0_g1~~TRINITY_DN2577_c0_g1_i2.p1  ORF type:complete len:447 (+),score=43.84 TRINITY_DN2577_c0_g1_i2:118-1458(+)